MNKKVKGKPIVVTVQKDSKVMIVAGNSVPMKEKAEVLRYDKAKNERESILVWRWHNLHNKVYGMLDQATSWRSKAGGHL